MTVMASCMVSKTVEAGPSYEAFTEVDVVRYIPGDSDELANLRAPASKKVCSQTL